MSLEPPVRLLRRTVHRSFHKSIVGSSLSARSIALPPPPSARIDLVVEVVIDGDTGARSSVDAMHVSLEVLSVVAAVQEIVRGEQIGVDHLVLHVRQIDITDEQCVHGVRATSEREQRF